MQELLSLLQNRNPLARAQSMRGAADAFVGPEQSYQQPMLDPEIALMAGMPEMAQYGLAQQARTDANNQRRQENALKLLTLIQAAQSNDDRTAMGGLELGENSRQFDAGQAMRAAQMAQQGDQFTRRLGFDDRQLAQQGQLAGMADQRGWAQLMQQAQEQQAMQPLREQQGLATLLGALAKMQQSQALSNAYNAKAAAMTPQQQAEAAGQTAAAEGGNGSTYAMLALAALAAAYFGRGKIKGMFGRGGPAAAGGAPSGGGATSGGMATPMPPPMSGVDAWTSAARSAQNPPISSLSAADLWEGAPGSTTSPIEQLIGMLTPAAPRTTHSPEELMSVFNRVAQRHGRGASMPPSGMMPSGVPPLPDELVPPRFYYAN